MGSSMKVEMRPDSKVAVDYAMYITENDLCTRFGRNSIEHAHGRPHPVVPATKHLYWPVDSTK